MLLLAGCGGTTAVREPGVQVAGAPSAAPVTGAPLDDDAVRIAVVTHGPASSKFWAIIRNGVDSAARRLDVLVDYQSPDVFSVERMSALIDQAVATKPDGLVVSIPSDELAPAIRRAVQAGHPGRLDQLRQRRLQASSACSRTSGQIESRAGLEAGRRLAAAGVRRALCLNQESDNKGVNARCAGLAKALREAGGEATTFADRRRVAAHAGADRAGRRGHGRRRRAGDQLGRRARRGRGPGGHRA